MADPIRPTPLAYSDLPPGGRFSYERDEQTLRIVRFPPSPIAMVAELVLILALVAIAWLTIIGIVWTLLRVLWTPSELQLPDSAIWFISSCTSTVAQNHRIQAALGVVVGGWVIGSRFRLEIRLDPHELVILRWLWRIGFRARWPRDAITGVRAITGRIEVQTRAGIRPLRLIVRSNAQRQWLVRVLRQELNVPAPSGTSVGLQS